MPKEVLISLADEVQLKIVMNILEENSVNYIVRDSSIGGYMRIYSGASIYGTDILVDEENIEKARDLIDNLLPDSDE